MGSTCCSWRMLFLQGSIPPVWRRRWAGCWYPLAISIWSICRIQSGLGCICRHSEFPPHLLQASSVMALAWQQQSVTDLASAASVPQTSSSRYLCRWQHYASWLQCHVLDFFTRPVHNIKPRKERNDIYIMSCSNVAHGNPHGPAEIMCTVANAYLFSFTWRGALQRWHPHDNLENISRFFLPNFPEILEGETWLT